ncbi:MAG: zf-TFIIB domain-containing protein [Sandaracinaceae bacterium]
MTTTRTCPLCRHPMEARHQFGMEIDMCTVCAGVFLDPGESEAQGIDTGALFGVGPGAARELMVTERRCPVHHRPMTRFEITGAYRTVEIERAACCGGIFLDPGEQSELAQAAAHAWRLAPETTPGARAPLVHAPSVDTVQTGTGAVFAAPPPETGGAMGALLRGAAASTGAVPTSVRNLDAQIVTERHCPRCDSLYRADRSDDVEVDVCDECGSMFFDPGEVEARGVDTAALFGVGSDAATVMGPSELHCPACQQPMEAVRVRSLAGEVEVDRATCCGGLFLDGGEHEPFTRAAKAAQFAAADRTYEKQGYVVGEAAMTKAIGAGASGAATAAFIRSRVDSMMHRMLERRVRQNRNSFDD